MSLRAIFHVLMSYFLTFLHFPTKIDNFQISPRNPCLHHSMPSATHSFWSTNSHLAKPTTAYSCVQRQSTRLFLLLLNFLEKNDHFAKPCPHQISAPQLFQKLSFSLTQTNTLISIFDKFHQNLTAAAWDISNFLSEIYKFPLSRNFTFFPDRQ